jgi:hypothetical protein
MSTNATPAGSDTARANEIATSYETAAANGTAVPMETAAVMETTAAVIETTAAVIETTAALETAATNETAMPDPARHTSPSEVIGAEIITEDTVPIAIEEKCQMPLHPPIAAIADYGSEDMDESE